MNFITPRTAAPDLADRYARLSPALKCVLQLKGLVFLPTSKTEFVHCLQRTGLRGPDGKPWTFRTSMPRSTMLRRQDLLTEELACAIPLVHQVTVDAVASGTATRWSTRSAGRFRRRWAAAISPTKSPDPEIVFRAFRLAIYTNDGSAVRRQPHYLRQAVGRETGGADPRHDVSRRAVGARLARQPRAGHPGSPDRGEVPRLHHSRRTQPRSAGGDRALPCPAGPRRVRWRLRYAADPRPAVRPAGGGAPRGRPAWRSRRRHAHRPGRRSGVPGGPQRRGDHALPGGAQAASQAARPAQAVPRRRARAVLPDGPAARQRPSAAR